MKYFFSSLGLCLSLGFVGCSGLSEPTKMTEGQEAALELYEDMIAADKAAMSGAEAADEAPETKVATGE